MTHTRLPCCSVAVQEWVPIEWLRESELKHSRVCMLAVLGYVATDCGVRLPGDIHQVSSLNAHNAAVAWGGMAQIFLVLFVLEIISYFAIVEMLEGSGRKPGDYGEDSGPPVRPRGVEGERSLWAGLLVSRFVIVRRSYHFASSLLAQRIDLSVALVLPPPLPQMRTMYRRVAHTLTALPPSRLSVSLGPAFDPLGFTKGMSEEDFATMQLKELKNGRLAMLAIGGIVTQDAIFEKGFPYF